MLYYTFVQKKLRTFYSIDYDIAGTRDRFLDEIIPVGATQSHTYNNDETNYGAERAIDGDYSTSNNAVTENGENPWLKISLGKVYCVQKVVKHNTKDSIWQTWTCTDTGCSCSGNYCSSFTMIVRVEGESFDASTISSSDCSYGNTVQYQREDPSKGVSAKEMVVIGKAATTIPYLGKFYASTYSSRRSSSH